ncbi:MAG: MBL fold metallo-hydrolase [Acidimicrobiia bacterium]|nr:MBL fold metallo-hydrolase [Acidimicrobiia bacterium]
MPSSFDIHEVAAGVWAAIAPGTAGPAVSNAAIIDLGDKTVVVDTFMTMLAAQEMATEVQRLTGRAPFLVVNSHWHTDHVRGNSVFADASIVGTERMKELMIEDAPKTPEEFEEAATEMQQVAAKLMAGAETPEQRQTAAGTQALADALTAEVGSYRLTLPNVFIDDRMDVQGERPIMILSSGRGHTESDLFVHIPDGGVVVAGDLLWTGMHPKTDDGFPALWAAVLDDLVELNPATVVSGHGPVGSATDLSAMADYMRQLDAIVAAARAGDLEPESADPPPGSEDWHGLARFRRSLALLVAQ